MIFVLLQNDQTGSEPLSFGINRLLCEAEHSPPTAAEVKNEWSYTCAPPMPSWHVQGRLCLLFCNKECYIRICHHHVTVLLLSFLLTTILDHCVTGSQTKHTCDASSITQSYHSERQPFMKITKFSPPHLKSVIIVLNNYILILIYTENVMTAYKVGHAGQNNKLLLTNCCYNYESIIIIILALHFEILVCCSYFFMCVKMFEYFICTLHFFIRLLTPPPKFMDATSPQHYYVI
jgi:hypothetical protein